MTYMLASVNGPAEAAIALAGGADIIDLKDPSRGAFAAVAMPTLRETVAQVGGRRQVSAVLGEVGMEPAALHEAASAMASVHLDFLKVALFPEGDLRGCLAALAPLATRIKLVAVLFADRAPDLAALPALAGAGFAGAMLDTADKNGNRLLDCMDVPALHRFVRACREHSLLAGLAGALEAPDVPRLLVLEPGVLGFRSALTGPNGRAGSLDIGAVRAIRALIPRDTDGHSRDGGTYRLLAARGYAPEQPREGSAVDRVFVRDLVFPVRIGAYARERAAPQRVRFAVEASVLRAVRPSQDMRDVFSYDVITDAIRILVDRDHIVLVETLAEQLAAMLLTHPRIVKVGVTVEKLDLGAGIAGVTIERSRTAPP